MGVTAMKLLIALVACAAVSGCVFSHHSELHQKGTTVSSERMAQIVPGMTDRDWILTNLGTPDRIHADKDGLEVFEYVSKTTKHTDSDFIVLFSWDTEKVVETVVTRIVMRNGIVESFDTRAS
jgi:outer membrane protein assembly factor BamE (lipoprotein component of BamABCDE complex)